MTGDAVALLILLGAVAVGIGIAVYTGWTGRRRAHFVCLSVVVPLFCITVAVAEGIGRSRTFEPFVFRVHMACAYAATGLLVAAIATGFIRLRTGRRTPHRVAVALFLLALPVALATGFWMMSTARPRSAAEGPRPAAVGVSAGPLPPVSPGDAPTRRLR
jgi:hypothetical protein